VAAVFNRQPFFLNVFGMAVKNRRHFFCGLIVSKNATGLVDMKNPRRTNPTRVTPSTRKPVALFTHEKSIGAASFVFGKSAEAQVDAVAAEA
jgi:hypothetical protein